MGGGQESRRFKKPSARSFSWSSLKTWRGASNQWVSKLSVFHICRTFIALLPASTCLKQWVQKAWWSGARTAFLVEKGSGPSWQWGEFQQSPRSSKGDAQDETINTVTQINHLSGWEQDLTPTGSIYTEKLKAPQRRETRVYRRCTWNSVPNGQQMVSVSE